jgi:hypothetical protein
MDLVFALLKVLAGGFLLFTVARVMYGRWVPRAGWGWVVLVGCLALANMLVHRWVGSTINPPFFTAVLFGTTLVGIAPDKSVVEGDVSSASQWYRRGVIAVVVGTALGWAAYVEIGTVSP